MTWPWRRSRHAHVSPADLHHLVGKEVEARIVTAGRVRLVSEMTTTVLDVRGDWVRFSRLHEAPRTWDPDWHTEGSEWTHVEAVVSVTTL